MRGYRSRVVKPAVALWLLVLLADTAAVGSGAVLAYVLAAVVGAGLVTAVIANRHRLTPQPVRVRRRY